MAPTTKEQILDFDVDRYLNPWIPHNRLYILPTWISRWLGYRARPQQEPHTILQWPFTIVATIASLCLVSGIGNYAPGIVAYHPPVIVASLGASAILDFNAIKSPLSQPRNAILGNTFAAICGVAIAKLFQLNPSFERIEWVSGAVGCALASWVMSLTNTLHPPGGATAVLASTQAQVIAMGWKFVPIVLLDSTLLVVVALIFNNVLRQYPTFWWTPSPVGLQLRREEQSDQAHDKAAETGLADKKAPSDASSDRTLHRERSHEIDYGKDGSIIVSTDWIQIPGQVELSEEELQLLRNLQQRLLQAAHEI